MTKLDFGNEIGRTYRILCVRSGGMMGYAESYAKIDDEIYETESKQEAESLAAQWQKAVNGSYSGCSISYSVEEY